MIDPPPKKKNKNFKKDLLFNELELNYYKKLKLNFLVISDSFLLKKVKSIGESATLKHSYINIGIFEIRLLIF